MEKGEFCVFEGIEWNTRNQLYIVFNTCNVADTNSKHGHARSILIHI